MTMAIRLNWAMIGYRINTNIDTNIDSSAQVLDFMVLYFIDSIWVCRHSSWSLFPWPIFSSFFKVMIEKGLQDWFVAWNYAAYPWERPPERDHAPAVGTLREEPLSHDPWSIKNENCNAQQSNTTACACVLACVEWTQALLFYPIQTPFCTLRAHKGRRASPLCLVPRPIYS